MDDQITAPEADRTTTPPAAGQEAPYVDRHKGVAVRVWMRPEQLARLDAVAEIGGITRSDAIRRMIDQQPIPDRTCKQAVAALGRVGGLIKMYQAATPDQIAEIWAAIKDIRRAIYGNADC